jgi:single-stranded-DNA-specific exonuclease
MKEQVGRALKKIIVREQFFEAANLITEKHQIHPVTAKILAARGFSAGTQLENFLEPSLAQGLPDPINLKNVFAAAGLIRDYLAINKKIALCCDFDVDGLSGGAMIADFIRAIGGEIQVFVPDRFKEGYGLNMRMIKEAAEKGCELLITVDYGTTNDKELKEARELGLKSIVIDHHHIAGELPAADIFINPHQTGCGFADRTLCAAGLAWYLLVTLRKVMPEQCKNIDVREYLELACLGTICDMVPLQGANRVIAKRGLEKLSTSQRPGIIALKDVARLYGSIKGTHVGFGIGPRINAAGRMLSGELVIELLTTKDSKKALDIAKKLDELNQARQNTEVLIKDRALKAVAEASELPWGIVVWDENFHTGVIGIVAQRLTEAYYRPSAVCGADGKVYKGSVRGIKGLSVVEALAKVGHLLIKFGGHEGAGGFAIEAEKLPEFKIAFNEACRELMLNIPHEPSVNADTEVELEEINEELVNELNIFAPFGIANPAPQLLLNDLIVHDVKVLKNQHTKVVLTDSKRKVDALLWQETKHPALYKGAKVKIICKPEVNAYFGNRSLQLVLQAVEES